MRTTALLAASILAAAAGSTAFAGDHDRDHRQQHRQVAAARGADAFDYGMQAVPNNATPAERAHGWRYFSDPKAHRAVVISPQGDYYLSEGKGLRLMTAARA